MKQTERLASFPQRNQRDDVQTHLHILSHSKVSNRCQLVGVARIALELFNTIEFAFARLLANPTLLTTPKQI